MVADVDTWMGRVSGCDGVEWGVVVREDVPVGSALVWEVVWTEKVALD